MIHIFTIINFGDFAINESDEKITKLYFQEEIPDKNIATEKTKLLIETEKQIKAYFEGKLKFFDLPLNPHGTDFMKKIWDLLCEIPYGKTATYGQIAALAGNPKASRAVGMANNKNPIPLIIPCHRVIGANGKLTGFRGGLHLKHKLLELEFINH